VATTTRAQRMVKPLTASVTRLHRRRCDRRTTARRSAHRNASQPATTRCMHGRDRPARFRSCEWHPPHQCRSLVEALPRPASARECRRVAGGEAHREDAGRPAHPGRSTPNPGARGGSECRATRACGRTRASRRRSSRRERPPRRPDVQRRNVPVAHVLLVHRVERRLLQRKRDFNQTAVCHLRRGALEVLRARGVERAGLERQFPRQSRHRRRSTHERARAE